MYQPRARRAPLPHAYHAHPLYQWTEGTAEL